MAPSDNGKAKAADETQTNNNEDRAVASVVAAMRKYHSNNRSTAQDLSVNRASVAEASSDGGTSEKARITKRVAQLENLLHERAVGTPSPIRSEEDLEEFEEALVLMNPAVELSDLPPDYPETGDEYAAHCRELFNAITNLVDIDEARFTPGDGTGMAPRGKDSIAVTFLKSKTEIEIHILAAKLMRGIRKAQLRQPLLGSKMAEEYGSFTLRFQAVVDVLKPSKLLVKSAADGGDEWINRIALNPCAELKRKRDNKTGNDVKLERQRAAAKMERQRAAAKMERQRAAAKMKKQEEGQKLGVTDAIKTPMGTRPSTSASTPTPGPMTGAPAQSARQGSSELPSKPMLRVVERSDGKHALVFEMGPTDEAEEIED